MNRKVSRVMLPPSKVLSVSDGFDPGHAWLMESLIGSEAIKSSRLNNPRLCATCLLGIAKTSVLNESL